MIAHLVGYMMLSLQRMVGHCTVITDIYRVATVLGMTPVLRRVTFQCMEMFYSNKAWAKCYAAY